MFQNVRSKIRNDPPPGTERMAAVMELHSIFAGAAQGYGVHRITEIT